MLRHNLFKRYAEFTKSTWGEEFDVHVMTNSLVKVRKTYQLHVTKN
jgi:hypothetical protein